ncbi:hypothetical protein [Pedobacter sp. L105]|uniref:hypothetical protein n=1 Tax=Pedobacter sp. L105 TaxID=1641871 RepID=UPI00131AAF4E|nr:hypothetical protein [Pedobacter sp. L105]
MSAKFDIQIDLNGWLVPFHIERKGKGIFKIAYEELSLGHLLLDEYSRWIYKKSMNAGQLLNAGTTAKITKAIINY